MSFNVGKDGATGSAWIRRGLRVVLALGILALLAAMAAPFASDWVPALGLFEHFAVQLAAAALFCLLVALVLRMRSWAVLAAAVALWYVIAVFPFLPISKPSATAPSAPLKVLALNLRFRNHDHTATVNYLLASGADVIGTAETTPTWLAALQPLDAIYPYRIDCIGKAFRCGVALFSKLPFRATYADRINGHLPTVVWGTIDWQGRPLTLAALQLINPLIGLDEGFQQQQASVAAAYFGALPGDLVVMGDFNSAPWSALQKRFRTATGLDNRGRLAFTWPDWAPAMFRLPIDQIFTRGDIVVRDFRPGPAVGSDHLPVIGEIYRTTP